MTDRIKELIQLIEDCEKYSKEFDTYRKELMSLGEAAVDLLIQASENTHLKKRATFVWILGEIESLKVRNALIKLLSDNVMDVKIEAVNGLKHYDDCVVRNHLIRCLDDDSLWVAETAIKVLRRNKVIESIPALVKFIKRLNRSATKEAAEALESFGWQPETLEDTLYYAYATDNWKKLAELKEKAVRLLVDIINSKNGSPHYDAGWAADTLAVIGKEYIEKSGVPYPEVIEAIKKCLKDEYYGNRVSGVGAIAKLGDRADIISCLTQATMDSHINVRQKAAPLLGQYNDDENVKAHLKWFYETEPRRAAKYAEHLQKIIDSKDFYEWFENN